MKEYIGIVNKINEMSNEINLIKKEVKFDSLILEYKKTKKRIFIKEKEIKRNKNPDVVSILNSELKDFQMEKEIQIKLFLKVERVEKSLFSFRKVLISKVSQLDSKKNSFDYRRLILEQKNISHNERISSTYNQLLKKKISNLEVEQIKLIHEVKKLKDDKNPFSYPQHIINKNKSKINKLQAEFKKNKKVSKDSTNISIGKNKIVIEKLTQNFEQLDENIKYLLIQINEIDEKLSFKDADEIDKNSSISVKHLNVWYGSKRALHDIVVSFPKNKVIAIIGPSGCGKSTFLRTINRINDNVPSFKAKGKIIIDGEYDIFKLRSVRNRYDRIDISTLRTKVGMIFQQPNPFPMSIYKNVTYGPRIKGIKNKIQLGDLVEKSLRDSGLWEEVKDNLKVLGTSLSGGQQQRLCIARAIANEPDILLMDEPTSALDPVAAKKVEDLIVELKKDYTIIMVTHSMQQAQRISDMTAFFYQGRLIEYGTTKQVFEKPKEKETKEYVSGKFG